MSDQKDIIGIVKELQGKKCFQDQNWDDCCAVCGDLQRNFPAIAESLLIAVEALEKGEKLIESQDRMDALTAYRALASVVDQALSRIRSLPST